MPRGEMLHSEVKAQTGFELQECLSCRNKRCILRIDNETGTLVVSGALALNAAKINCSLDCCYYDNYRNTYIKMEG